MIDRNAMVTLYVASVGEHDMLMPDRDTPARA